MGRKKSYDRGELVEKAMEIFRDHGFAGTSAEMLVEGLGVNRYSLYAEFGSKQALFDAALERYDHKHLSAVLAPLEAPDASVEAIDKAFTSYASASEGWFRGRGCLMGLVENVRDDGFAGPVLPIGPLVGTAIGAILAGTAAAAGSKGNQVAVGAGTALEFHLAQPLSVDVLTQVAAVP